VDVNISKKYFLKGYFLKIPEKIKTFLPVLTLKGQCHQIRMA
jgi:hypothetical protein